MKKYGAQTVAGLKERQQLRDIPKSTPERLVQ